MDDFKNIGESLEKNIRKMQILSENILRKIQSEEPEKVAQILQDQKSVVNALKNKDFEAITKLQKKYADNSN